MVSFKPKRSAQASKAVVSEQTPNDLVIVARVGAAYGVKGWVKIHPFSHVPEALEYAQSWWIAPYIPTQKEVPIAAWQPIEVAQFKPHSDAWVAQVKGWDDRSQAEAVKGWQVAIARTDFPVTDDDEFYWVDLIGSTVVNHEGVCLGILDSLMDSAAHPIMQIKGDAEYLIPFIGVFVLDVNTQDKQIQVQWDTDATA